MESTENNLASLLDKATDYGQTSLDLLKLKALDTTTKVVSSLTIQLTIWAIVLVWVITLNIGLGLWLGELLGANYYGFFALLGIELLLGVIAYYTLQKPFRKGISNHIIQQVYNT